MIRNLLNIRRFVALLMPAVLLWSWMACVLTCAEVTEFKSCEISVISKLDTSDGQIDQTTNLDSCKLAATPATFPDRQTVTAPVLTNINNVFLTAQHPAFILSSHKSDINQNSPPLGRIPIFLLLNNFRI